MIRKSGFRPLAAVALLVALGIISATGALAVGPELGTAQEPDMSGARGAFQNGAVYQPDLQNDPSQSGQQPSPKVPHVLDASLAFVPDTTTPGTCPAPANGGTTQVGCTFVLDLILNTGSNPDGTAQQSYLTFTYQTIQNARVSTIGTSCVPTNTVTGDLNTFDAILQNEVCNGPGPCVFRGLAIAPGSFAYASGALQNCPTGCGGVFPVAQVGICAASAGQARLHWQFSSQSPCSNGAPPTRDTEIVAYTGELIQNCTLFADYTFSITGGTPTNTPTATQTHTPTPTLTGTSTPTTTRTSTSTSTSTSTRTSISTTTRTRTPAITGTPCSRCQAEIRDVSFACNPDGTLHWSAIVKNNGRCTLTVPYRVTLQVKLRHQHPNWVNANISRGNVTIPPRSEVIVFGDFCYMFPDNVDKVRAEFALDGSSHECMKKKKSREIHPCSNTPTCQLLFPDVPVNHPYYSVVLGLASNGVVSGYADGTFRPDASVNRGQVAKMIVLAYELNTDGQSNGSQSTQGIEHFSDVPANSPYYTYIERAYSLGVVSGYSDGTFQPYSEVSRAQLAKMVVKALSLPLSNPAQPSFSDVGAGSTFYNYIETVKANGLLAGYEDGTFKPGETMTRGEVAEVLDQAR